MKYTINKGQVTIPIEELNKVEQDLADREIEISDTKCYLEHMQETIDNHIKILEQLIKEGASIVVTKTITKSTYFSDPSEKITMAVTDVAKWDVKALENNTKLITEQKIKNMSLIKFFIWRLQEVEK